MIFDVALYLSGWIGLDGTVLGYMCTLLGMEVWEGLSYFKRFAPSVIMEKEPLLDQQ
jgi:hypothetical protein